MPTTTTTTARAIPGGRWAIAGLALVALVLLGLLLAPRLWGADDGSASEAAAGTTRAEGNASQSDPVVSLDGRSATHTTVTGAATLVTRDGPGPAPSEVTLPGRWTAVAADHTGARVALMPDLGPDRTIYAPGGRTESRIAVVTWDAEPRHVVYDLPGNVVPEAFSRDGRGAALDLDLLFVIDHRPAADPTSYRVRALPLAGDQLGDVLGPDKTGQVEDMRGVGRRQVAAPDGAQLYTYYSRQVHEHAAGKATPAHDHGQTGAPGADGFVHVLDLTAAWAYCVDLPQPFGDGPADSTAIAVSPAGRRLAVVDTWAAELVVIETAPLRAATRTGEVDVQMTRHPLPADLHHVEGLTASFDGNRVQVDGPDGETTIDLS